MLEIFKDLWDFRMNDCYYLNNDYNYFMIKIIFFIKEIIKKRCNNVLIELLYK